MKNILITLHKFLIALMSCLIVLFSSHATADTAMDARLLASQCAQCHGTTGNTLGDFDSIVGDSFSELYDELMEMKAEEKNEVMHKQIQGYTNDQIWLIADYYANDTTNNNGEEKVDDEDEEDEEDEEDDEDDEDDEEDEDDEDDEEDEEDD